MGQRAAKHGDKITATDMHIVMVPAPAPKDPVPTPLPHKFEGRLSGELSTDVRIMGKPAAVVGSTADNFPPHAPTEPGTSFQGPPLSKAPSNKGAIRSGSVTVKINGKAAARDGDPADTCSDGPPLVPGKVVVEPGVTVNIG